MKRFWWSAAAATLGRRELAALFDRQYYLDRYPDVARARIDPLTHYVLYGAEEGRQPHPLFDSAGYLESNPDVAARGMNPLLHFLRWGWKERRAPNALFDAEWYGAEHPEVRGNPFLDYVARRMAGEAIGAGPGAECYLPARAVPVECAGRGPVDIIIPVYAGIEATRACVESVLRTRTRTEFEIVLVNDASPAPELADYLRSVGGVRLVENAANLGYVESVNRAMALDPERDVVLLNSDTEVAGDWLDRLAAAAWAAPRIGTATPFSNHATICSYPAAAGVAVGELDAVFRAVNAGRRVEIPTAVGFCMYIRRDCLRETGAFDAEAFGKGYGEENDFSLRAARLGWRHVLAADVFVGHLGAVSFGAESEARKAAAERTMRRMHPGYDGLVARHMRRDPAEGCRFAASAWRMRHGGKPVILAVSHALGGGVERHLRELRTGGEREMLVLRPLAAGAVQLENLDPGDNFRIALDAADGAGLRAIVESCGVTRVEVHHVIGHELDIERLIGGLGLPFDFTAHDYYAVCPQVNLADGAGRYCGEPDAAGCNRCIADRPSNGAVEIAEWRGRHQWLVEKAEQAMAPSQDTARRLERYFPGRRFAVAEDRSAARAPAPVAVRLEANDALRIAAVGVMTREKGLQHFRECAAQARRRRLQLEFELIGRVGKNLPQRQPFAQSGPYAEAELGALLRSRGIHVVWFPATCPETFSYALSACLEAAMPVVAPGLGAFPERLEGRELSWIVPWDWKEEEFLGLFQRIREENFLRP